MFENGQKVKFTKHGVEVEGRIDGRRTWCQVGGHCHTKHQTAAVNTAVMAWGYKVHAPIVQPDGTFYKDRHDRPLMGLGYMDEKLLTAA